MYSPIFRNRYYEDREPTYDYELRVEVITEPDRLHLWAEYEPEEVTKTEDGNWHFFILLGAEDILSDWYEDRKDQFDHFYSEVGDILHGVDDRADAWLVDFWLADQKYLPKWCRRR